jgi:hypothetical protein
MPVISFNNQVLSAFGLDSVNLSWSLSSTGQFKTVELLTTGTTASKAVRGVAFNTLLSSAVSPASGTGSFATLSAFAGTTFRVDSAYNGQTMAVVFTDDSSSLFTVVTGATTTQQNLTANGFDTSYPVIQQEVYLGYP